MAGQVCREWGKCSAGQVTQPGSKALLFPQPRTATAMRTPTLRAGMQPGRLCSRWRGPPEDCVRGQHQGSQHCHA